MTPRCAIARVFERKLYVIRKRVEHAVDKLKINPLSRRFFYIVSLSANTLTYKGMLTARQLGADVPGSRGSGAGLPRWRWCISASARTRSRRGRWRIPTGYIAHNGEINTLRGNINWMHARQGLLASDIFGDDLKKMLPDHREGGSDTAIFDNVLELLVRPADRCRTPS